LDGGYIVLGSLSTTAFQKFILRAAGDEGNWMRHHVAHSITMVNGYAINQNEINAAHHLFMQWIRHIRIEYIQVLHTYVMGLRKREGRANRITHAYCQESYSRANWRTHPIDRGVNTTQRLWVAYNRNADAYDEDMKEWQHTRSICGSMSSKAAKSLKKSTDTWARRREDQKRKSIEEAVNWIISGEREDQEPLTVTVNGQTLTVPKVHASQTVDEMQEELMRAVRGEKDYHDHLVNQYKDYHRAKIEAARGERQEAVDKARKAGEERGISGKTTIVGYTPAQLAEINPEVQRPSPVRHSQATPEQDRFNQYLDTSVGVGWIGADGRPEKAEPPTPEGAPEGAAESLQDKIRNRKPRLKP
jgi:hypothetical protein